MVIYTYGGCAPPPPSQMIHMYSAVEVMGDVVMVYPHVIESPGQRAREQREEQERKTNQASVEPERDTLRSAAAR